MTKKQAVPKTKVEEKIFFKMTKTQKDLYVTRLQEANESARKILEEFNKQTSRILGRVIDDAAVELGIDDDGYDYDFDQQKLGFQRRKKKND